jgi:UDP-N-acetylglucosamine 4-epimerase
MLRKEKVEINGDGETSRDFCFIENVIQMNLLAATAGVEAKNHVYNVALGDRTSLSQLFEYLKAALLDNGIVYDVPPVYKEFRDGDVRHSQADISKAQAALGYTPLFNIREGINKAMPWYIDLFR